jgi:hypothetical protein
MQRFQGHRRRRASVALAAMLVLGLVLGGARARAEGRDPAAAQFERGLAEMQAGRYATGCPALAESYRLDPRPGALFTLAECEHKWGKLATALSHYQAYLDLFANMSAEQRRNQVGRDAIASTQRDRLLAEAPTLTLVVASSAPAGTRVTRDGEPIGADSLGVPRPVDPGEHVIQALTPEGRTIEQRVTLSARETRTLVLDPPRGTRPAPVAAVKGDDTSQRAASRTRRTWIYVTGGIGLAGIAVGAVTGFVVLADKSTIEAHCGLGGVATQCDSAGVSAADRAHTMGLVSDIAFGVGAAGLVAAGVLWLTEPRTPRAARTWRPLVAAEGMRGLVAGVTRGW